MSEPARAFRIPEDDSHRGAEPLKDWLAAMKRYEIEDDGGLKVPAADNTPWGPRLVQPTPAAAEEAEAADISELMAENLMLKARLQVEQDRQDSLQTALAVQIRELREHIAQEMSTLEELRAGQVAMQAEYDAFQAERDSLRRACDRSVAERDSIRAERDLLIAERDGLRGDRDLWRARAEALAQPLFQAKA